MLRKNKQYFKHRQWTSAEAKKEIDDGLKLLDSIDKPIVSVFGSHMVPSGSKYYTHAEKTGYALGKKGYAMVTGGGPGIMYAANAGTYKAGMPSIGIRASMIKGERVDGSIYTHTRSYSFLFVRRFILAVKSEALIFYPGGFGTLNELFEYVVLIQTGMDDKVPLILVNKSYWKGLFAWAKKEMVKQKLLTHGAKDLDMFYFVDDVEEIVKIIEKNTKG
ncbi:TPA: TIGR00730 family Rossman fold protein [Candidatus Woesearchaeota archaeon]|nr:TIGR00730 family Rossman fold protein [Candidatus Woesearchaeota archaeon]